MQDSPVERARRWREEGLDATEIRARLAKEGLDVGEIAVVLHNVPGIEPAQRPDPRGSRRARRALALLNTLGSGAAFLLLCSFTFAALRDARDPFDGLRAPVWIAHALAILFLLAAAAVDSSAVGTSLSRAIPAGFVGAILGAVIGWSGAVAGASAAGAAGAAFGGFIWAPFVAVVTAWLATASTAGLMTARALFRTERY